MDRSLLLHKCYHELLDRHHVVSKFDKKPQLLARKVLDISCGEGWWIEDVASEWANNKQDVHFTGIDLESRAIDIPGVEFEKIDYREGKLPFEDASFDYIHARNINKDLPEGSWLTIAEEFARILEPGGTLEIVQSDLIGYHMTAEDNTITKLSTPHPIFEELHTKVSSVASQFLLISPWPLSLIPATVSIATDQLKLMDKRRILTQLTYPDISNQTTTLNWVLGLLYVEQLKSILMMGSSSIESDLRLFDDTMTAWARQSASLQADEQKPEPLGQEHGVWIYKRT